VGRTTLMFPAETGASGAPPTSVPPLARETGRGLDLLDLVGVIAAVHVHERRPLLTVQIAEKRVKRCRLRREAEGRWDQSALTRPRQYNWNGTPM